MSDSNKTPSKSSPGIDGRSPNLYKRPRSPRRKQGFSGVENQLIKIAIIEQGQRVCEQHSISEIETPTHDKHARIRLRLFVFNHRPYLQCLSRWLEVPEETILGWDIGRPISECDGKQLSDLLQLWDEMVELMAVEAIPQWLDSPNEAFEGKTPLELVKQGRLELIEQQLFYFESGTPI